AREGVARGVELEDLVGSTGLTDVQLVGAVERAALRVRAIAAAEARDQEGSVGAELAEGVGLEEGRVEVASLVEAHPRGLAPSMGRVQGIQQGARVCGVGG